MTTQLELANTGLFDSTEQERIEQKLAALRHAEERFNQTKWADRDLCQWGAYNMSATYYNTYRVS